MFLKFSSQHRSTLLCLNVVKYVRREIGEIVRYVGLVNKKIRQTLQLSLLRGSRPKSARVNLRQCTQSVLSLIENRCTFYGVIAERVNTAKLPRRVNTIFGGSKLPDK